MLRFRPCCEPLEDRALPAVFLVTQPDDVFLPDGNPAPGNFRWAIQEAEKHPNELNDDGIWDEIHFATGIQIVELTQPLGRVLEAVVLRPAIVLTDVAFVPPRDVFIFTPEMPDPASDEAMVRFNVWFVFQPAEPDVPGDGIPDPSDDPGNDQPGDDPPDPSDDPGDDPPDDPEPDPIDRPDPVDPEIPTPTRTAIDPSIPGLLIPKTPPTPNDVAAVDEFFLLPNPNSSQTGVYLPKRWPMAVCGTAVADSLPGVGPDDGKIIGKLFEDYNGDGFHDADEPVAPERVVYLDLDGNGRLDEGEPVAVTNQRGQYRFEHLRPGYYQIEQLLQPHLVQTAPKDGYHQIELTAGEVIMDVDFGAVKVRKRKANVSAPEGDSRRPEEMPWYYAAPLLLAGVIGQRPTREERRVAA